MSAATKPEPGTAVARQPDRAAQLDAAGRNHLAEIRAQNALVMTITSESWGQAMTPNMRRAFAEYMRRFKLDISEVDNLGGKPYRNGRYYERRIAEMRTKGLVEWTAGDHIGPDQRLEALAAAGDAWAVEENTRRLRERIRWAVPEDATHAYVTRVKLKGDQNPLEGCDFITPLRMKSTKWGDKVADPVGAAEPEKTVITRSWRRVGLLAAAEIPELRAEEEAMDVGATEVAEEVEQIAEIEEAREQRAQALPPGRSAQPVSQTPLADPSDPYSEPDFESAPVGRPAQREPVATRVAPPRSDASRAVAEHVASTTKDPYDADDAPSRPRSSGSSFPLPFTQGASKAGTPLRDVSDKDLSDAVRFADGVVKYESFVEVAAIELEERRLAAEDGIEVEGE